MSIKNLALGLILASSLQTQAFANATLGEKQNGEEKICSCYYYGVNNFRLYRGQVAGISYTDLLEACNDKSGNTLIGCRSNY